MNEVTVVEKHDLISPEDIEMIRQYNEIKVRFKVWEDAHKEMFKEFLESNGLESYKQDGVILYQTKPYKKKQVDTKALKEDGLYDSYTRDVWVKGSLRIQFEYEDD